MSYLEVSKDHRSIMSRPQMLGFYSHAEENDDYEETYKNLRVLKLPDGSPGITYDLGEGYVNIMDGGKKYCSRVTVKPGLKKILKWILNNRDKLVSTDNDNGSIPQLDADFVASRGVFAKILQTPYQKLSDWSIGACKFKGTIYFYEFTTEKQLEEDATRTDESNKKIYGGLRFEELITEPINNTHGGENGKQAFVVVAKTKVGRHNIVYNAEVDAVENECVAENPSLHDFVEIKTIPSATEGKRCGKIHQYKLLQWWAQCCLTGTEQVICGYRDENFLVNEIDIFTLRDLVELGSRFWSPYVCNGFLKQFLDFAKEEVKKDGPDVMYEFKCEPVGRRGIRVACTESEPTPDRFVIPESYMTAL